MSQNIGKRKTQQREAIFEIINKASGPVTVNEIVEEAKNKDIQVGIATVYRTVKLLLASGEIQAVTLPDGQLRYENAKLNHHHHFHCNECDTVIDIHECSMHLHDNEVEGHLIQSHEITLFGLCKNCR